MFPRGPTGLAAEVGILGCKTVAGVFGALTAFRRVVFVRTVPNAATPALVRVLVLVLLAR